VPIFGSYRMPIKSSLAATPKPREMLNPRSGTGDLATSAPPSGRVSQGNVALVSEQGPDSAGLRARLPEASEPGKCIKPTPSRHCRWNADYL
jgi:hypothetical protein